MADRSVSTMTGAKTDGLHQEAVAAKEAVGPEVAVTEVAALVVVPPEGVLGADQGEAPVGLAEVPEGAQEAVPGEALAAGPVGRGQALVAADREAPADQAVVVRQEVGPAGIDPHRGGATIRKVLA